MNHSHKILKIKLYTESKTFSSILVLFLKFSLVGSRSCGFSMLYLTSFITLYSIFDLFSFLRCYLERSAYNWSFCSSPSLFPLFSPCGTILCSLGWPQNCSSASVSGALGLQLHSATSSISGFNSGLCCAQLTCVLPPIPHCPDCNRITVILQVKVRPTLQLAYFLTKLCASLSLLLFHINH